MSEELQTIDPNSQDISSQDRSIIDESVELIREAREGEEGIVAPDERSSLEILVDLAKTGEINPWDVDLQEVTNKFLKALDNTPRENLKEAARGIFFASVLLRIKSDYLANEANQALNFGLDDEVDDFLDELDEEQITQISFRDLEQVISKRSQRLQRYRKITLKDLISALQAAEVEEEVRIQKREQQKLLFLSEGYEVIEPELSDDMRELTHAENLEGAIDHARAFLLEHLVGDNFVKFRDLAKVLGNWSDAFLAIIFLSHESEVYLLQKSFYGELLIYEPGRNNDNNTDSDGASGTEEES